MSRKKHTPAADAATPLDRGDQETGTPPPAPTEETPLDPEEQQAPEQKAGEAPASGEAIPLDPPLAKVEASEAAGDQQVTPATEKEAPAQAPKKARPPQPTPGDCRTCKHYPGAVTCGAAEMWLRRTGIYTRRPCGDGPCAGLSFERRI